MLRFHADAPLPSSIDLRLSKAVVRSVAGVDDTLTTTQVVSLELHWKGDINQDGRLDLSDVFALVDILGTSPAGAEDELYDFDEDGSLGLGDVHTLMAHFPVSAKRSGWQEDAVLLPNRPLLLQPYPNPFNAETVILLALPAPAFVELVVHNLLGQVIRVLRSQSMPAGVHRILWNGRDEDGRVAHSGVYFVVLDAAGQRSVQRLLLVH